MYVHRGVKRTWWTTVTSSPAWTFTSPQGSLLLVIKALVRTVRVDTLYFYVVTLHFVCIFDLILWYFNSYYFFLSSSLHLIYLILTSFTLFFLIYVHLFYFMIFVGDISVCVFRVSDGTVLKRLSCGCVCGVAAVTFSPDGSMLAVAVQVRTLLSYM